MAHQSSQTRTREQEGRNDGQIVARDHGSNHPERRKLLRWLATQEPDVIGVMTAEHNTVNAAYTPAELLYFALHPDHDGERRDAENYWHDMMLDLDRPTEDIHRPDYFWGFVQGYVADM